jgi:tetratricopeptide (TPR) repeat protein
VNLRVVLFLGVCFTAHCSELKAQSADRSVYAEYLFQEGVRLMREDHCSQAISKFQSSYRLDPTASSLMNLGTCYARLGRTATAWRTYRKAAAAADDEKDEELKEQAFKAITLLTPTLTNLRIVTPPGSAQLSLTLNGERLTAEEETSIPLDPGENIIEATAPGRTPWRRRVSSSDLGATIVIEVPELPPGPGKQEPSPNWRAAALVTGGVGVSAIVAGLLFGASAQSAYRDSQANCAASYCNHEGHLLRSQAIERANIATYTVGLGALAAGAGVILWFVAPSRTSSGVGISPWLSPSANAIGATASGRL